MFFWHSWTRLRVPTWLRQGAGPRAHGSSVDKTGNILVFASHLCWETKLENLPRYVYLTRAWWCLPAVFLACWTDSRLRRALELAQALEYMHHGGSGMGAMMHRDIKSVSAYFC